jgi:hypothetical protein
MENHLNQQEPHVLVDQEYAFFGIWDKAPEGRCRVRIIQRNGDAPILLISELADNPSTSITNMMEHLAPEIIREFLPQAFEELELPTIIEHYPPRGKYREALDLVTFEKPSPRKAWLGGRQRISLGEPHWRHLPIEDVRRILGEYADEV